MTPTDARRRAERTNMLVDAFENLDGLANELEITKPRPTDGDYRAVCIDVKSCSEAGGCGSHHAIELPLDMGKPLLAFLREAITDELRKLGVEP